MFAVEPHMSQRRAENELEISDTSVQRILEEVRWHPFKMQKVQALEPDDLQCRVYRIPCPNLAELRQRIIEAFNEVPVEMIRRVIVEYERRPRKCIEVGGESVEIR
uniref:Uncharacterized protein n=1 Tax=Panagrolaimus sp. ES5 TaxID=591445 RepID=A0AC34G6C5_9BILA